MSRRRPIKAWALALGLCCWALAAQARDHELGVNLPLSGQFAQSQLSAAKTGGGGVYWVFPTPFLVGVDAFTAQEKATDEAPDPPKLSVTYLNLGFLMPRKEGMDVSLGFGLGNASVACSACAELWDAGSSSQWFLKGTGGLFGLRWSLGLHKTWGKLTGKESGGLKAEDFSLSATWASLGIGYEF